ncbi:MAG: hypothetical protein CME19_25230 [Gemmatimonadetes bacterium]|nr:hypothetical protein [Gemmatimonadota bacterium]|tara:strand:+ start:1855 stop:2229 length:375 start_codon:yes stop_codon:yes gene_type:complete
MRLSALFALLLLLAGTVLADESGQIEGVIVDAETAEPLIGANVVIYDAAGLPQYGASTDLDGRYVLGVPVREGDRVGLILCSTDYPRILPNTHTLDPPCSGVVPEKASISVMHESSALTLFCRE